MGKRKLSGITDITVLSIIDSGLQLRRISLSLVLPKAFAEILQKKVIVAPCQNIIHRTLLHGFFRISSHMIADHDDDHFRPYLLKLPDNLPVKLHNRCLRFHHHDVNAARLHIFQKLCVGFSLRDSVIPAHIKAFGFQIGGRISRHHRIDVCRRIEPLELTILSQKGDSLRAFQRRICNGYSHDMNFPLFDS